MRSGLFILCSAIALFALAPGGPAFAGDALQWPTLDIIPQASWVTGADVQNTPGGPGITDGTLRLNLKVTEPITKRLSFAYAHGNIDETLGAAPTYPNVLVEDLTDDFSLSYTLTKRLNLSAGYFYRHRVCCPAAAAPGNAQPLQVHFVHVAAGYAFAPIPVVGTTVSLSAGVNQAVAHKTTPLNIQQEDGLPDEGDKATPNGAVTLTQPIGRPSSGFSAFGTYTYAADYFDSQPIAFWYNIVDYGLNKVVNKNLSFNADFSNLVQHRQGYPFPDANVIHRAKLVITADIKVGPDL
ncbi:MAG TPA: hypothetical protein VGZ00_08915 [Candidatus Baltobacteraceae bacterium]|jgi:hypothetical protein|nr:hypothetical protein [Candidatus Baltobacteraceae bacterium]